MPPTSKPADKILPRVPSRNGRGRVYMMPINGKWAEMLNSVEQRLRNASACFG
jgi:hypothetical protein